MPFDKGDLEAVTFQDRHLKDHFAEGLNLIRANGDYSSVRFGESTPIKAAFTFLDHAYALHLGRPQYVAEPVSCKCDLELCYDDPLSDSPVKLATFTMTNLSKVSLAGVEFTSFDAFFRSVLGILVGQKGRDSIGFARPVR